MRVAILGEPSGWHVGRLRSALDARGHEAAVVRWSELAAAISTGGETFQPATIDRADLVVVRGMPAGSLEDVIFRMDALGRIARRGTPVVNSPRSLELAIDKYLSLALLAEAAVPVPRTIVAQDREGIERAWRELGCDCVYKPLFGSQGRGIERLSTPESLGPFVSAGGRPGGGVVYLQEFVPHPGWDARVLLVGDQSFAMRRVSDGGDWRTNVARGARPERFEAPVQWIELARHAAAVLETEIAGVDLLPATDGRLLVLEINAVPGWRALETVVGGEVAGTVARYLEGRLAR
jgi:ribosomal protein S6--L-glutamate ligase